MANETLSDPGSVRHAPAGAAVADAVAPLFETLLGGDAPIRVEFWDGSSIDRPRGVATLRVHSPNALRRVLWMPNDLGWARAHVSGELDLEGDIFAALEALRTAAAQHGPVSPRVLPTTLAAARRVGAIGPPLPPPPEEVRVHGRRHSPGRDSKVISHHYDVGNDFYALVLGPAMTYSCARYTEPGIGLETAQAAKHELICRKLGPPERPGARLLDVGCGWGSMAIHAARHHGAHVVGITISTAQAELARKRAAQAGVADQIEIRLQDYRELGGETFDAIASIGMSEHVGKEKLDTYFRLLHDALRPQGRLLNHAISSVGGTKIGRRSFMGRYVFPDGELVDVGDSVRSMERAGFEVRDVESLREHYALTLRAWVANLEAEWDRAVELVGEARAKVWRLYMAGAVVGFESNGTSIHQVLGVVPDGSGRSAMPATRRSWG